MAEPVADTQTPLESLRALALSLGESPSDQELEQSLPLVTRLLKTSWGRSAAPDLGVTEPAFGLRFDFGRVRGDGGGIDGTS